MAKANEIAAIVYTKIRIKLRFIVKRTFSIGRNMDN